jgi:hypothetical protein
MGRRWRKKRRRRARGANLKIPAAVYLVVASSVK